ncbi:MAG: ABC transporter permease subunit [Candidatus Nanopelagicales bacterium]
MSAILSVARHEVTSLRRERLPKVLLSVFVLMVALSSFIGWLTNQTVSSVWRETVRSGLTTAPNPFVNVSPLYFSRNTVIYVVLIGALSSIVLGAMSGMRDRRARVTDLVLSRPIDGRSFLAGKLLGVAAALGAITTVIAALAWLTLSIITGPLKAADSLRLLAFFALVLLLLTAFAALGLMSGLRSKQETGALLLPIAVWALITFVLPQLSTGANPVSLLNPVPAPPATAGAFATLHAILGPFSITEQFKTVSGLLLGNPDVTGSARQAVAVLISTTLLFGVALMLTPRAALRTVFHD